MIGCDNKLPTMARFCFQGNAAGCIGAQYRMLKAENIRYLVVHCSDTPDEEVVNARDIHEMHLGFGWHGVGYHRVIERDGRISHGRPDFWIGAHVKGFNEQSLGVCLIGRTEFTKAQFASLEMVLRDWKATYPQATICGHCDFDYTEKTCPNFDVAAWCVSAGIAGP